METKFFKEIEKKMDVKTIKDFEKEVRTKINSEMEKIRNKNVELDKLLQISEKDLWVKIINGEFSWIELDKEKNKKLFRLINIYYEFSNIVDNVKKLNKKVENIKKLKDLPVDDK